MDPTGLLDAVLAVAIFPGAVLVTVAGLLYRLVAGYRDRADLHPAGAGVVVSCVAAVVGCAMLPLVGSPALRLPAPSGAPGNVVAVALLLAVAVDLGGGSLRASALAAAAAVPIAALAAAGSSLSTTVISSAGGPAATAARALAAGLLVLAGASTTGGRSAPVVGAALALCGSALVVPAALAEPYVVPSAAVCLGFVTAAAALARGRVLERTGLASRVGAIAALAVAVAATTLALISNRV